MTTPPDPKPYLPDADRVVDALPWKLGTTEAQRKRARGRVSALAHQVAALVAGGWTLEEVRVALGDAPGAAEAPDAAAQERRWRGALKRARAEPPSSSTSCRSARSTRSTDGGPVGYGASGRAGGVTLAP